MMLYSACVSLAVIFFFFKQKTAYEIPKRDWSSDVCSSDLFAVWLGFRWGRKSRRPRRWKRSEEHTSELQSRFGISYAVFCLKKKNRGAVVLLGGTADRRLHSCPRDCNG